MRFFLTAEKKKKRQHEEGPMDIRDSIQRQTESSLLLASRIAISEAKEVNFVFSPPPTLHVALSMVAAGSTGQINDQILSFLRVRTNKELNSLSAQIVSLILADGITLGGPTLYSANGIWVDESMPLKPAFPEIMKDVDGAEAKAVDFQTKVRLRISFNPQRNNMRRFMEIKIC